MAVAHDASSESHAGTSGSTSEASFSWSHNPVGTPRGVLVFTYNQGPDDIISGVTYDGVALSEVSGGIARDTAGEGAWVKTWFLGSSVPTTDPATIEVTRTNNPTICYAMAATVTAGSNTEVHEAGIVLLEDDGTLAEQNVTDGSPGSSSVRYAAGNSGLSAVPSPGANSTAMQSIDLGARVAASVVETTAGQGSRPVGFSSGTSDDRGIVHLAVREAGAGAAQGLTGALFTKAPTFSTGAITSVRNLAGALFTKAPTFSVGSITATRNLAGALFTKAPTFFAGAFDAGPVTLPGTLFTKAPTFFVGGVIESQALAGVLFQKAPTFPQGAITIGAAPLDGVLFQRAPTFFQGIATAGAVNLVGTTFTKAPTFFAGTVTPGEALVDGELFENDPLFFSGVLSQQGGPQLLGGVLFTKAPTFPQGTVSAGAVGLTGVLFQKAPTFSVGSIATTYNLAGVLYQNTPSFLQGELIADQILAGVLFQNTPVFFQGSTGVAGAVDGVLFVKAPTFFTGSMGQLGGSFWRPNPVAFTLNPAGYDPVLRDEVPPWAIEVDGEEFELAPSFFAGALS